MSGRRYSRKEQSFYRPYVCSHYHTLDLAEINLGMNAVCRKYVEKVREAYGEHGIEVPKLNEMLAGQGKK